MFGVQFYPTPQDLVERMLSQVDFSRVKFALEPSAGKGDIAHGIQRKCKDVKIDCVEIDADLQAVLQQRGFRVAGSDFLQYDTHTRYDLVAMNPPFADGEKHLLHALDLMQHGGQIVCLLNAETLKNQHTAARMDLARRIEALDGHVEYISNAFRSAERKTGVEIAIVRVSITYAEERDMTENLRKAFDVQSEFIERDAQLAENDVFKALVRQYEFECRVGEKLIDDYQMMRNCLPTDKNGKDILSLVVISTEEEAGNIVNRYIRELRHKYWSTIFGLKQMRGLLTQDIATAYLAQIEKFRSYDFTLSNVLQVKIDLSKHLSSNVEDAIMKMFDELTYEHSMDKNTNIHYYNGWKTNKAFKINKKIILKFWGLYDNRWGGSWSTYRAKDKLAELEKIMNYLDSGRTDGVNCDQIISDTFRSSAKAYAGEKIKCKFFDLSFKKKGTVHVWFTDLELLKKFNVYAARNKNWLPKSYGKAAYSELPREERAVVDSFEGKAAYEKTMECHAFFLDGVALPMLRNKEER